MTANNEIHADIQKLRNLFEQLGDFLREGIRAAHQHCGIDEETVAVDITAPSEDGVIMEEGQFDPSVSIYDQMDTCACLDYLYFGGLRKSKVYGGRRYCKDQDAFFKFFNIDYSYVRQNGQRTLKLTNTFCEPLCALKAAGSKITEDTDAISDEQFYKYVCYMMIMANFLYLNDKWDKDVRSRYRDLIENLAAAYAEQYRR